jgi:hypothetical protein
MLTNASIISSTVSRLKHLSMVSILSQHQNEQVNYVRDTQNSAAAYTSAVYYQIINPVISGIPESQEYE